VRGRYRSIRSDRVDFIDADNWIGVTGSGGVLRTSDAGTNWLVESTTSGGGSLYFLDNDHGWIYSAYAGTLFGTTDGGDHLHQLAIPNFRST